MKKAFILFLVSLFSIAFLLNFAWENLHFSLYAGNAIGIQNHVLLMLYAAFVDAFWIFIAFIFARLVNKELAWKLKNLILFSGLLIFVALLIEIRALNVGRWVYSESMPLIFGIGLSPLIQLAVTGLLSVFISEKITSFS